MSGLMKDIWSLRSASAINLSQSVVLVEVCEENLASHRFLFFLVGKVRRIAIAFWDNCRFFKFLQCVI